VCRVQCEPERGDPSRRRGAGVEVSTVDRGDPAQLHRVAGGFSSRNSASVIGDAGSGSTSAAAHQSANSAYW